MSVELTYNNTETPIQDVPSFIKVLYKNLNSKKKVKKKTTESLVRCSKNSETDLKKQKKNPKT